jgi:two-component system, chemotaxis family, protein-glutamate methylesterase/glutaminase
MEVDYSLDLTKMGAAIADIVANKVIHPKPIPKQVVAEARRSEKMAVSIEGMDELGVRSPYGCPDCGGVMWQMKEKSPTSRFRCHIGHSYLEKDLLLSQVEAAEKALWVAVRMMEDRKHLLVTRAEEYAQRGFLKMAEDYTRKAEEMKAYILHLKTVLIAIENNEQPLH